MKSLISLNSNHTAVRIQFEKSNVCLQNLYTVCNCLSSVPALCTPLQWQAIQVRWPAPAYELPSLPVSRPRPLVSLWCDSWWPTRWALSRRRRHLWQLQQQHHGWGATGKPSFWDGLNLSLIEHCFCLFLLSGKNCELCISGFFRLEGTDPTSPNVCQPCECNIAGTVNSSVTCAQVLLKTPGQPL